MEPRMSHAVSRRSFLGGLTAAVGCLTAEAPLGAQAPAVVRQPRPRLGLDEYDAAAKLPSHENPDGASRARAAPPRPGPPRGLDEYDAAAKLAYNENPYGPSDAVMKAMTNAFK